MIKALETPEEKRARRLAKKVYFNMFLLLSLIFNIKSVLIVLLALSLVNAAEWHNLGWY